MISSLLCAQPVASASVLSILEALRCGAILVSLEGNVIESNTLAVRCLGKEISLSGNKLRASDRGTNERLSSLVAFALNRRCTPKTDSMIVKRADRLPLLVRAIPLEHLVEPSLNSVGALLLLFDLEFCVEIQRETISEAFGLTQAEADLAAGMVLGRSLPEMALARGIKIGTVRAHLKAIFLKTNTHGQAELVRLLTRMATFAYGIENNLSLSTRATDSNANVVNAQESLSSVSRLEHDDRRDRTDPKVQNRLPFDSDAD
jgi:DNA-binding CsgD family transcriptional regulator